MIFDEVYNRLITYRGDYGVPVVFSAGEEEGFSIGDRIIFTFNTTVLPDKSFTVNRADFTFDLKLTQNEAEALCDTNHSALRYSVKRYSESGAFLETLLSGNLVIKESLIWQS